MSRRYNAVMNLLFENGDFIVVTKPAAWRAYGLPDRLAQFLTRLVDAAPITIAALGDAGVLASYPNAVAGLCTYSDVPASQEALVNHLLEEGFCSR